VTGPANNSYEQPLARLEGGTAVAVGLEDSEGPIADFQSNLRSEPHGAA